MDAKKQVPKAPLHNSSFPVRDRIIWNKKVEGAAGLKFSRDGLTRTMMKAEI